MDKENKGIRGFLTSIVKRCNNPKWYDFIWAIPLCIVILLALLIYDFIMMVYDVFKYGNRS